MTSEYERERWDDGEVEAELRHEEEARERCLLGIMEGRACACLYHDGLKLSLTDVEFEVQQREATWRDALLARREAEKKEEARRARFENAVVALRERREAESRRN